MNDPTPPRMTDQAPELLPCPLCNATLVLSGDYTHETAWNFWCHPDRDAQCILADYQIPTAQDMRTPLAHEAKMWNTRPTPAERPAQEWEERRVDETGDEYEARTGKLVTGYLSNRHYTAPAERPVPQVREALASGMDFFKSNVDDWGASQWFERLVKAVHEQDAAVLAKNDMVFETCKNVAASSAMRLVRDFEHEIRAALTARPSDAAVAWRYRHKDTEGWLMLKNGRDPTEWLKQWPNTEYEVEALAPMRPEAADEIERLRNQLVKAQATVFFCEWLDGYFGGINRRDELTALEANSIRAKLYGEVYPPAPLAVTDEIGEKS